MGELSQANTLELEQHAGGGAPGAVEARARFVFTVLCHLRGTYNVWGVRRWFVRRRAALDGKSPLEALSDEGAWSPESPAAMDVSKLARALLGMPAT